MQVEHISEMKVGDFIQLPPGEWHKNPDAKAMLAKAQAFMYAHISDDPPPQFQIQHEDKFKSRLERIR